MLEVERKRMDEEEAARIEDEIQKKKDEDDHEAASQRSASQVPDGAMRLRPPIDEDDAPAAKRRRLAIANPLPSPTICEAIPAGSEGHSSQYWRPLEESDAPSYAMPSKIKNKQIPQRLNLPNVFTSRAGKISKQYVWGQLTTPSKHVIAHWKHNRTVSKKKEILWAGRPSESVEMVPEANLGLSNGRWDGMDSL